jgi:hypothetical protein
VTADSSVRGRPGVTTGPASRGPVGARGCRQGGSRRCERAQSHFAGRQRRERERFNHEDPSALLSKRWDLLAQYKDQYWRDRKKLGLREALRVAGALRAQARFFPAEPAYPGRP